MSEYSAVLENIRKGLLDSLDFTEEISDDKMLEKIDEFIISKNKSCILV